MTTTVNATGVVFNDGSILTSATGGVAGVSTPFGGTDIPRRDFKFFNYNQIYADALKIYLGQVPSSYYLNETAASGYKRYDTTRDGGAITLTDVLNTIKAFTSSAITTSLYQNMYDDMILPLIVDNGATYTSYWTSLNSVTKSQPGIRADGSVYGFKYYVNKPGGSLATGGFVDFLGLVPCIANCTFSGVGTIAVQTQNNVSSLTDNGTGDFSVNYVTALGGSVNTINITVATNSSGDLWAAPYYRTDLSNDATVRILTKGTNGAYYDPTYVNVTVHR